MNGGPRGYGAAAGGAVSEWLPIDGDPETLNYITGEPQGGMYVVGRCRLTPSNPL